MLFFRSLLFYVGYALILLIFSIIACTVGTIMPRHMRHEVVTWGNAIIIVWLNLSCGIRLKVEGKENLPKTPSVIVAKHQSSWETYYLQRLFRPVSTILKRELFKVPFFGWGLYFMHPIAINRSSPREAIRQVQSQGALRLRQGNNVLVFPEGTRVAFGSAGKYARSGASLALSANVPLIPVAHNAGYCWPASGFIKRPGVVHVVIGSPLQTTNKDSRQLTSEVQEWIESQQKRLSHTR